MNFEALPIFSPKNSKINDEVSIQMCVECSEIPCSIIRNKKDLDLCFLKTDRMANSTNSEKKYSCYVNYFTFICGPGTEGVHILLPYFSEKIIRNRHSVDDVSQP